MEHLSFAGLLVVLMLTVGCDVAPAGSSENEMNREADRFAPQKMPPLTDAEKHIIQGKDTEQAFTGKYWNHFEKGVYRCRQCGTPLYLSDSKFRSDCGWPSFDDEIEGAVTRVPDADGMRTEIVCANCG